MNNTAGPNGHCLTLLVFDVVPQLPLGLSDLPEQRESMKDLHKAQCVMIKATSTSRIRTALNRKVRVEANREIKIDSQVLFYREKSEVWEGPYYVVAGDGKSLWMIIKNQMKRVAIDRLRSCIVLQAEKSYRKRFRVYRPLGRLPPQHGRCSLLLDHKIKISYFNSGAHVNPSHKLRRWSCFHRDTERQSFDRKSSSNRSQSNFYKFLNR